MYLFSTAFVTNIKKFKKIIHSHFSSGSRPSLLPAQLLTYFLRARFKTEPIHCHFHRKQPVPGM